MNICPCCGNSNLEKTTDFIFDQLHKFLDCSDCDCLYIKRHDTGEWIESSTLNTFAETGASTGNAKIRERCGSAVRGMAS